jgi:hypothetical protein
MKKSIIILSLLATVISGFSQTVDDALRYSQQFYEGTARYMAMGGAFGALGSDFSVASTNPAGMGIFRSSVMSITPELSSLRTTSTYNGTYAEDSRSIFNLGNLGYVQTTKLAGSGWKYFQFGMGMNRLNNYNSNQYMQGENLENSRLDIYQQQADGIDYKYIGDLQGDYAFDLAPAWEIYLLDTFPSFTDYYYTPVPYAGTMQKQTIRTKGSTNEWLMSISGNYSDKLFIGATLGMPYIRYMRETLYTESDVADTIPNFNSWGVKENLNTSGWGINLKLGIIYQAAPWLRLGAAFHTPTYYWNMRDSWYTTHYADLELTPATSKSSITGNYQYRFSSPMRFIGDAAILINKIGLISGEYEFVDFANAKFSARDYGFNEVNTSIRDSYQSTHNLRIGTEWRYGQLSFRAGYQLSTSPYSKNLNDGKRQSVSGGIGLNFGPASIDFAYVRSWSNEDYYMYSSMNIQPNAVKKTFTAQQFALTLKTRL